MKQKASEATVQRFFRAVYPEMTALAVTPAPAGAFVTLEQLLREARQDLQSYHDRNGNKSVLTERLLGRIDAALEATCTAEE